MEAYKFQRIYLPDVNDAAEFVKWHIYRKWVLVFENSKIL